MAELVELVFLLAISIMLIVGVVFRPSHGHPTAT
jgi:hypothetical protein